MILSPLFVAMEANAQNKRQNTETKNNHPETSKDTTKVDTTGFKQTGGIAVGPEINAPDSVRTPAGGNRDTIGSPPDPRREPPEEFIPEANGTVNRPPGG